MKARLTHFVSILFSIMMAVSSHGEPPHVFWTNDEIAPGDTVQVIGNGFSDLKSIKIAPLGSKADSPQWQEVKAIQPRNEALKFIMPESQPAGLFRYWIQTASGEAQGILNAPEIWWSLGDLGESASPGGELRIYGKNFIPDATGHWQLELVGEKTFKLAVEGNRYHGTVVLPQDLPIGSYQILLPTDNLAKDKQKPQAVLQVKPKEIWPSKVFNVKDFEASGNGKDDDTPAVERALASCAKNQGGILYFPRGRYKLSKALQIPPYVTLRGAGEDLTSLCWTDVENPPKSWISGSHHFAIENVNLYCSNYLKFVASDKSATAQGNVRLSKVRIRGSMLIGQISLDERNRRYQAMADAGHKDGCWLVDLGGPFNQIIECDLFASGGCVALTKSPFSMIKDNMIRFGRGAGSMMIGGGFSDISHNVYQGSDLTSGNGAGGLGYGNLINLYLAENQFKMIQGWNRETITSDSPNSFYFGKIQSSENDELLLDKPLPGNNGDIIGSALFIVNGTGKGQWRTVTERSGNSLKVDQPFAVKPDTSSVIAVITRISHWLVVGNRFSDVGVAVQLFGSSVDCIVSGNHCERSSGFVDMSLDYQGLQPSWNIQWLRNRISDGNYYASNDPYSAMIGDGRLSHQAHLAFLSKPPINGQGAFLYGCVAKNNLFDDNSGISIEQRVSATAVPQTIQETLQELVVEKNEIHQSDIGIKVTKGTKGILVRKNQMDGVDRPYDIQGGDVLLEK